MNWDLYDASLTVEGKTRRDRAIYQTQRIIDKRTQNSPARKTVLIDGVEQDVVITSSTEFIHKKINALPNEKIYAGSIVEWDGYHFIITATDVECEVYQRGEMYQCNVYMKWQNEKGEIIGRYGYSEDISQFASGVVESKVMMSLEQVFKIQFPLDSETVKLRRDKRFLLDILTDEPNAYILTNRNVITQNFTVNDTIPSSANNFDGKGKVLLLTLTQTQRSAKDNFEFMIADYFDPEILDEQAAHGNNCVIKYSDEPKVRVGGNGKTFTAEFTDADGNIVNMTPVWSLTMLPGFEKEFSTEQNDNSIKIIANSNTNIIGTQVKLTLSDPSGSCTASIYIKAVSLFG